MRYERGNRQTARRREHYLLESTGTDRAVILVHVERFAEQDVLLQRSVLNPGLLLAQQNPVRGGPSIFFSFFLIHQSIKVVRAPLQQLNVEYKST